jgi:hypothetical protein
MSAILDALLNELVDGDDGTLARLADKLAPLLMDRLAPQASDDGWLAAPTRSPPTLAARAAGSTRSRPLGGFRSSATAQRWSPVDPSSTRGCVAVAESGRNAAGSQPTLVRADVRPGRRRQSEHPATGFVVSSQACGDGMGPKLV